VKRLILAALSLGAFISHVSAATEFDRPWFDAKRAIILDPYHANSLDLEQVRTDPRVLALIHKATEGTSHSDRKYAERRTEAKVNGFLWGSYHLLTTANTLAQVDYYLSIVGVHADETYALDVECLVSIGGCASPSYAVSVVQIKEALRLIKSRIGHFPLLYTNGSVKSKLATELSVDTEFESVKLWYARFRTNIAPFFPDSMWDSYTIWQFSSEINCNPAPRGCPYRVPGTAADMDVNVFPGDASALRAAWPIHVKK
jgi:GH25 family lysozyme M1 (1,4-beta-N-acetylmuramidase)